MSASFASVGPDASSLAATGLPRSLMRHVLLSNGIGVGSRVLVVGDAGETAAFLRSLGMETVALAGAPGHGLKPCHTLGATGFHGESAAEPLHASGRGFDLVLVRDSFGFEDGPDSSGGRTAAAHLLASLHPGGVLVLLAHFDPQVPARDEHAIRADLARRLDCFPGRRTPRRWPDGPHRTATWKRWLQGKPRAGFLTASLQIPTQPLSRAEWLACVHEDAGSQPSFHRRSAA